MKNNYWQTLVLMALCSFGGYAQSGSIQTFEDGGIRSMMDQRRSLNFQKKRTLRAWSVQILVTRDKYEANSKKYEAQRRFADLKIDWVYEEPYYRLNVGAFYTKIEAAGLQYRLIPFYPDAYIFKNHHAKPSDFIGVSSQDGE